MKEIRRSKMEKEWKIDTWWKKTLLFFAYLNGFISILAFLYGIIIG
jgi:hypothetical protein